MIANQEIMLVDISNLPMGASAAELKLNDDLARVEEELDRYTNKASKEDYALAVASGLLAGIVDALYVGETPMFGAEAEKASERANEQINHFIQKCTGLEGKACRQAHESKVPSQKRSAVDQNTIWKASSKSVPEVKRRLAVCARRPTPQGFAAAVVLQFLKFGTFKGKDGEWHLNPAVTSKNSVLKALTPAILTGFLNWVVAMSDEACKTNDQREVPEAIIQLATLASRIPMRAEIAKCANNWFDNLVRNMDGTKGASGADGGVTGSFISVAREVACIPGIKETGLLNAVEILDAKQSTGVHQNLAVIEALGKQAIPVLLNEAIVRMGFFISRLAHALGNGMQLAELDWAEIVPIGNRTVDRMMTVASMTLSFADTADAAVHACLESAGNLVLFSQRFVTRFNYVAAGRATLAVVREVVDDAEEAELLRDRRLLVEARSALVVERLEEYMDKLSERVDAYIAEDLQTFFEGFAMMDLGLASGDADLVIRGNVTIQRVLGREPQFTNQEEFDDLMFSDDDFIL